MTCEIEIIQYLDKLLDLRAKAPTKQLYDTIDLVIMENLAMLRGRAYYNKLIFDFKIKQNE